MILAVKSNTVLAHHGENKPINDQVSFHNEYEYEGKRFVEETCWIANRTNQSAATLHTSARENGSQI